MLLGEEDPRALKVGEFRFAQGDRPDAEGTAASGGGVPGFELKPSGRSLTGVILMATRSPLSNLARDGPTPITRFSKYFWRKSSRILFCRPASLVISALPIKAGPVAEPIRTRTRLPRLMRLAFQVSGPV